MTHTWSGQWVCAELGVQLSGRPAGHTGVSAKDLAGLALRDNPKRAHLLVSTVLGKHIPTDPRLVYAAGRLLGSQVGDALAGLQNPSTVRGLALLADALKGSQGAMEELTGLYRGHLLAQQTRADVLVLGFAETATGLGHCVAETLGADYLHSTRRLVPGVAAVAGFAEAHSHATGHLLLAHDAGWLSRPGPVVLVDDELSTGHTALNTIQALEALRHRDHYVVAALLDVRSEQDRDNLELAAARLGVRIEVTSLAAGRIELPEQVLQRGQRLVADHRAEITPAVAGVSRAETIPVAWPRTLPTDARHGFSSSHSGLLDSTVGEVATSLLGRLADCSRVLVLGFEELMYTPLRIAMALADRLPTTTQVRFASTTRSPVLPIDKAGYAIRNSLTFASHDDPAEGPGPRYAYNVLPTAQQQRFADIVVVLDERADTAALHAPGGLLEQLSRCCDRLQLVVLPTYRAPEPLHGPAFGSYQGHEVSWLLSDLSDVELEAPTEDREEAIQSGGAHYAESLPIEYQPNETYLALFRRALAGSAQQLAHAVGMLTELVIAERGPDLVLASLARAGTPVGILMQRWARELRGLELAHYAVSIVRGRGIDPIALGYLARHHDCAAVLFVDGWTGKGAIARELSTAITDINLTQGTRFSPELAVLADTGSCVSLFGTRADYLIPSACLNSTVSGLVSRTVLNDHLIAPGMFHGAKFYAELADVDVSGEFLDAVTAQFSSVAEAVGRDLPALRGSDRRPTWQGWNAVEQISTDYGINNVNLVKPGVGETTRVLLRRIPWKVLVNPMATAQLDHVLLLAEQRGVAVELVPDLAYSCVGLIHPAYTRGAVGADGSGLAP